MNPLHEALTLGVQAAADGFDWKDPILAMDKVQEEMLELLEALRGEDAHAVLDELGDLLFSVVQVARLAGVDAERALDHANTKFKSRYAGMQNLVTDQPFAALSLEEQMALWKRVKEC